MAEIPAPVGYWCDHEDEPPGERTHEGWDWADGERVWQVQPDTISAHGGTTDWDPEHRRCPRAVPVYAVDAPALTAQVEQLTAERDANAHLLKHWTDEHIILQVVSGDPVHAAWCYRCRLEVAEVARDEARAGLERVRSELALAKARNTASPVAVEGELTTRQRAVLAAIRDSVQRRGYPPSMREIGEAVGVTSTATVSHHLRVLRIKGYLQQDPHQPRTIRLTDPAAPKNGAPRG